MTRAGQAKISRRRALRNGLLALTLSTPALARGARKKPIGDAMTSELTANEIVELLNLEPNATCGFVRVTFIAKQTLAAGALPPPFERSGPLGSALYFLVTPDAPVRLHRIRNDQLYHYYLGDPLELFLPHADGQHVQLLIPGNTFHTARLLGRGRWFLRASTEWPGVVPADVEIGDLEQLAKKYPAVAGDLRSIAASAKDVKPSAPRPR